MVNRNSILNTLSAFLVLYSGCNLPGSSDPAVEEAVAAVTPASTSSTKYVYVASGTTYAGLGVVTATPSNTIAKYKENGAFECVVIDYSNFVGDTPVDMINLDDNYLLVLVENASARRIDKVKKDCSQSFTAYLSNSTALSVQLRSMFASSDGGLIVSKGTMIEKFSSNKSRVMQGAAAYVNAPAAPCATSTTLIPRVLKGLSDTIVYLHAAATPNNRIGLIKSPGYGTATDCLSGLAGPTVNHMPTAGLLLSTGRLLIAYSNTTGPVNEIYTYPLSATAISAGTSAYNNLSVLSGVTFMSEMPDGKIIVASGTSTFNTVEQFIYDTTTHVLSRVGSTAFISASIYTKSISSIVVAN